MNIEHRTSNVQHPTKSPSNPQSEIRNPKWEVHRYESVDSTNDLAIRMAEEGAPEGTVVIADEQTAGKGRHGRSWSSPPGSGLYLSVILRPNLPFEQLWQMAFVASVAAAEAIAEVSSLPAQIKWPNDVLVNGRKVCGILVEAPKATRGRGDTGTRRPVIIGIGINVNIERFPSELEEKATSIAIELGHPIALEDVEKSLLAHLEKRLADSYASVFDAWREIDCTVGRHVVVNTADTVIEGTAVEVNQTGDLIIEHEGIRTRITAGEVILRID